MEKVKQYIFEQMRTNQLSVDESKMYMEELYTTEGSTKRKSKDMAVIGMSCRFAGVENLDEYWDLLTRGKCTIGDFPSERRKDTDLFLPKELQSDPKRYRIGGYLNDIDKFDPSSFRISPKEAELMDPRQRLLLQVAWSALEDAGYGGQRMYGSRTGVFVGMDTSNTLGYSFLSEENELEGTGSVTCILARRVSYILNLFGPSMVIDTACSSGLVALHTAIRSIEEGDCDFALVGGVNVMLLPTQGSMLDSPNYELRAFDHKADGTVWGEGLGAVLIRPLEDAIKDGCDIYAVIKGTGINNDGASNGLTAPSAESQEEVLCTTWEKAGVDPETISYIEAHGTGTKIGDPIELRGITKAFRRHTNKRQFCGIGSVKTNIGHSNGTSGIASLIKVILSLRHKQLPSTLKFEKPNPLIDFADSPIYVNSRLQSWQTEPGVPRRCGISSFGFSGTNCHVVLEEAPTLSRKSEMSQTGASIFTLSAKNNKQLLEYIDLYLYHLENNSELSVTDICYTNQLGRNHMVCRVAMIVESVEELKHKLRAARELDAGHEWLREKGIWTGNASLPEPDAVKMSTEERKLILSRQADEFIKSAKPTDRIYYEKICELYVQGADVDWKGHYGDDNVHNLIHLPTYPYEAKRFWVSAAKEGNENVRRTPTLPTYHSIHPLLDECIVDSFDTKIYKTEFQAHKQWVLTDHKIADECVVPGTTYLEMAYQAGLAFEDQQITSIGGVQFYEPLVVGQENIVVVHTQIRKEQNKLIFRVASLSSEEGNNKEWTLHATGEMSAIPVPAPASYDINTLLDASMDHMHIEHSEQVGVFTFGPRWHSLKDIYKNESVTIAYLELPNDFEADLSQYILHPSLLDIAVGSGFVTLTNNDIYLPFGYDRVYVYGSMPRRLYSIIKPRKGKDGQSEIAKFDISVVDHTGQVVLEIEGFSFKRVGNIYKTLHQTRNNHALFQLNWQPEEIGHQLRKVSGSTLVWGDGSEHCQQLVQRLRASGESVNEIYYGEVLGDDTGIGVQQRFETKLARFDWVNVGRVLFFIGGEETVEPETIAHLDHRLNKSLYGLFHFVRTMVSLKVRQTIDFVIITRNAYMIDGRETFIQSEAAAAAGLGKVIQQEYPNLLCRTIDLGDSAVDDMLLDEIKTYSDSYAVSTRDGRRYVQILENAVDLSEQNGDLQIRNDGVYVISGGTSGIGLESAKMLASHQKQIQLILLHRSEFPTPESWTEITQTPSQAKLAMKVKALQEVQALGATIHLYRCDVSNATSMMETFNKIRQKFTSINGIIHSAGVAGDGFLIRKSVEEFQKVVAPKINGTWLLDHFTSEDTLDFFILYSSIASLLGSMGQGDYTAANSYLDSYAGGRALKGKSTLSINWAAWKETGMAVDYGVNEDNIFKAIGTDQGVHLLQTLMSTQLVNVIAGELNYAHELFADLDVPLPIKLSSSIYGEAKKHRQKVMDKATLVGKIALTGKNTNEYTPMEIMVSTVWSKYLGLDEISIFDDFYNIGGDSIQAIKIVNEINDSILHKLDVSDLFENPTISELAEHISNVNGDGQETHGTKLDEEPNMAALPLSSAQKRIWFLHKLNPGLTAYHMPAVFKVDWEVDLEILNRGLARLIDRQSVLKTVISEQTGSPIQMLLQKLPYRIECVDLSGESDPELALKKSVEEESGQPFNFSERLFRVKVFKLGISDHRIYVSLHHLITDGWGYRLFIEELFVCYDIEATGDEGLLKPLAGHYSDWIEQQAEWKQSESYQKAEAFWKEEIGSNVPVLDLPIDFPRPPIQTYNGSSLEFELDEALTAQLKAIARELNVTMHMLLLAVFSIMLNKLSGTSELVIGTPYSGRDEKRFEHTIGLFMNTVCIRVSVNANDPVEQLMQKIREKCIRSYRHGNYPFSDLVEVLNPERDMARNPIYTAFFQYYENVPFKHEGISQHELSLHCKENSRTIAARFEYNTDLFEHATIVRLETYFRNITESVTVNSRMAVGEIDMLPVDEKNWLNTQLNGGDRFIATETVHQLFEHAANAHMERPAVTDESGTVTFGELNARANRFAHYLIMKNIQPNQPVVVLMDRSCLVIEAMLGIMKSGGAYVPIDRTLPEGRIAEIIEQSGAEIIIVDDSLNARFNEMTERYKGKDVINYASFSRTEGEHPKTNPHRKVHQDQLMYITYTSGSTGVPKGVMVSHANVANFLKWATTEIDITTNDRMVSVTSISFDISVFELFGSLLNGAHLYVTSDYMLGQPKRLLSFLVDNEITVWQSVPALISIWLEACQNTEYSSSLLDAMKLRTIMIGGEPWGGDLAEAILHCLPNCQLLNMYGPTETTIWVSSYRVTAGDFEKAIIPIGKPIVGNTFRIVDPVSGQSRAIGVAGEIWIKGKNVTNGYYKDLDKTRTSFVMDASGNTLYRTGDIGRIISDGNVEYIGRNDGLIKLRGYRIEIGEIEGRVLQTGMATKCGVVLHGEGDIARLVCFYTPSDNCDEQQLIRSLEGHLPSYMMPTLLIPVEEMPLTLNSKLDRRQLQKLANAHSVETTLTYEESTNEMVDRIKELWEEVLGIKGVRTNDNFFHIGGNSLLVARLNSRLESVIGLELQIVDFFKYPTINKLAKYLELRLSGSKEVLNQTDQQEEKARILALLNQVSQGNISTDEVLYNIGEMKRKNE